LLSDEFIETRQQRKQLTVYEWIEMNNPKGDAVIQPGLKLPCLGNVVNHSRDRGVSWLRSVKLTGKVNGAEYQ